MIIYFQTCQYSSDNPNILPDFTEQMDCMWDNCTRKFSNIQTFHYHIIAHVNALPPGNNLPVAENCRWEQCTKSYFSRHHLLNHMKKHTHAKVVGCPDCGSAFCSNTKFRDHCQRRISSEVSNKYAVIIEGFLKRFPYILNSAKNQWRNFLQFKPINIFFALHLMEILHKIIVIEGVRSIEGITEIALTTIKLGSLYSLS